MQVIEEWRDIAGYEGLYQVSNLGRVRSLPRERITGWGAHISYGGYIMAEHKHNTGYMIVRLHKDGKRKPTLLHRIVAKAFIPNPHGYSDVNHIDENKCNNVASNLEWCNDKHNSNHGTRIARMNQSTHGSRMIEARTISGEYVGTYLFQNDVVQSLGISPSMVADVLRGRFDSTKGYILKYISAPEIVPLYAQ